MRGEYNKSVYDRTTWYAFVDESTFLYEKTDLPKRETQEDHLGEPIPNINTDSKPNKKTDRENDLHEKVQAIIARINKHAGTAFRADTKESSRAISARLKSYTLEEALCVVDAMAGKWLSTNMREYYTPITLFREANFEKYLQYARTIKTPTPDTANNPDFKLGKYRYRPQSEFGTYSQYITNCNTYGHTALEQGAD